MRGTLENALKLALLLNPILVKGQQRETAVAGKILTQKGVVARWHPKVEEPIGQRDKGRTPVASS
jgi:hypothetical protein